jgi:secreted PhoX family phosphatase
MFPGIVTIVDGKIEQAPLTKDQVDVEIAAHGMSVAEIQKVDGKWQLVKDGKLNRRVTADTEMLITGPAAGSDRLKTGADATGTKVLGTINNCAGGITPWGTVMSGEENFHGYFGGELPADHREAANYKRLGIPEGEFLRPLRRGQGAQ